jgi:tetratricopeptide (TPR) repeat protein
MQSNTPTVSVFWQNALRIAVWLVLGAMAVFIWQKKRQPHPAPMPAPLADTLAAPPVAVAEKTIEPAPQQQQVDTFYLEDLLAQMNLAAPAAVLAPGRLAENYRALALVNYSFPKFNTDQRPDGDAVFEAEKMLWRGQFAGALSQLAKVPPGSPDFEAAQRLQAHVFCKQGRLEEACRIFEKLKRDIGDDETDWYLLLCRLAQAGQNPQPFEQLAAAVRRNPRHSYAEEVADLLEKIETLRREGKL